MHEKVACYVGRFCAIVLGVGLLILPRTTGIEEDLPVPTYECLASAIYHEARGEPVKAQRAVAEVVIHRAFKSGKSFCEVVAQKHQFTWYARKGVAKMDAALERMLERAFEHPKVLVNENFLFFYSGKKPMWASKMTCRPIGRLNFCKER